MNLSDTISDNVRVGEVVRDLEAYPVGSLARYIARELSNASECLNDLEIAQAELSDAQDELRATEITAERLVDGLVDDLEEIVRNARREALKLFSL